jgi:hydrogenase maturation protease
VLIVGLGNPLMGDDGVGHAVVEQLRRSLADRHGVRAEYGDTDALRLPSLWHGEEEVWLVDAVSSGAPPGTIHRLDHETLLAVPQEHHHAHRLSLPDSLRWIALGVPEMASVRYRLWGIEVRRVAPAEGLSPVVAAAAEQVAAEIADRLV